MHKNLQFADFKGEDEWMEKGRKDGINRGENCKNKLVRGFCWLIVTEIYRLVDFGEHLRLNCYRTGWIQQISGTFLALLLPKSMGTPFLGTILALITVLIDTFVTLRSFFPFNLSRSQVILIFIQKEKAP
ncbi:hypothetical protein J2S74_004408 [Evansella vedderi]|uniref:Uncharacterized protein n=1 Tax=Evansella vedderi TaxID=38282 RepID=A0ABU0A0E1_9BACI|nr:hypothetical protein [Evansella vedderi]